MLHKLRMSYFRFRQKFSRMCVNYIQLKPWTRFLGQCKFCEIWNDLSVVFHFCFSKLLIVTESFIQQQLQNLKVTKATGLDDISAKYLKMSAPIICKPLTNILNLSIKTNSYPDMLKKAKVSPIFKKGSRAYINNYRRISVLPNALDKSRKGITTYRNGPERTEPDQNGPERTETDLRKYWNGLITFHTKFLFYDWSKVHHVHPRKYWYWTATADIRQFQI